MIREIVSYVVDDGTTFETEEEAMDVWDIDLQLDIGEYRYSEEKEDWL